MQNDKNDKNIFLSIATIIVEKRNLVFFLFTLMIIFCTFSIKWSVVENELTAYLDESTVTRVGLEVLEEEFVSFGMADIMISNISITKSLEIADEIKEIKGVNIVNFEHSPDYYKDGNALFSVVFDSPEDEEVALNAMNEIREKLSIYDLSVKTTVGVSDAETLAEEMQVIVVVLLLLIIVVLTFTSKSFAEVPILLIIFGVAALLNMGTNFIFDKISFISDTVGMVLQLALAIDYAIILCHRFAEEREHFEPKEACIQSLSKAIPEISSSSLTTISGLFAMSFMNFGIGADLSRVLIKSILISLLCVFTLMPGLLLILSPKIDKTKHKNFVPSIKWLCKFSLKMRYIVPPIFILITIVSGYYSQQTTYLFSASEVRARNISDRLMQEDRITNIFGSSNSLGMMFPSGDYEKEVELIKRLESLDEVDSVMGLSNTEAMDDYKLTDYLTARELSELMDLDYEESQLLYTTFAMDKEDYGRIVNPNNEYELPLIDLIIFIDDLISNNYITLDDEELVNDLNTQARLVKDARLQLESENYSCILLSLNLPEESQETFDFLDYVSDIGLEYYEEILLVGNSTSNADLSATFTRDNLIISILSALFVVIVLLFTFGSVATPLILILIIQSAIFMNFAVPYLQGSGLYFIGYLVVSSIQMGANVDYAIVITNRYLTLKNDMDNKTAIIQALDESFATVITSGSILALAGVVIQYVTTDGTIAALGECIGRGTTISIVLVLFVLPQILYLGTNLIEKTSFSVKFNTTPKVDEVGEIKVNGRIKGYVSGYIDAKVYGTIKGDVSAKFDNCNRED